MRGIAWFLGISFGLAWILWEIVIRSGVSVLSWQFQLYAIPGAFAPAIATFVVRKWITREGFADAGLGLHLAQWRYYLIAWLIPLVVVAAIVAEAMAFGIARPDFTLANAAAHGVAGRDASAIKDLGLLLIPQVMIMALLFMPLLWGEEFGWRSYLQIRIFRGRPVAAAIMTGFIWGAWHFPVVLRGYNYPGQPFEGTLLLILIAMLTSYIFGWILEKSGSIWASSLAHSATNAIGGLVTYWFAGTKGPFILGYGGLLAIPPLFAVCLCIYLFGNYRGEPPAVAA